MGVLVMIKLIASDMDGTLLNSKHEISKENLEAIKKAEDQGIRFTIATGRDITQVKEVLKKYNLKCQCLLSNGAEYRDEDGNILEKIDIEKDKLKEILSILKNRGIKAQLFTNEGIYTPNSTEEALAGIVHMIQCFEKVKSYEEALKIAKSHPGFTELKFISNIEEFLNSPVEVRKIFAFYPDLEVLSEAKKEIEEIDGLAVSSSFINNIEITNKDAQKGLTLAKVAKKLGIKKEEVMVMGDSFNDYSMFTEFTETVAMKNAIPEVKEIAKYITDTNDNNGVAKAILKAIEE